MSDRLCARRHAPSRATDFDEGSVRAHPHGSIVYIADRFVPSTTRLDGRTIDIRPTAPAASH